MNWGGISRSVLWFVIGLIVAAAVFVVLRHGSQRNPVTMRTYTVAPEIANETKSALNEAFRSLSKDGPLLGRVILTADGRLLVSAPESVQKQVERILTDVASQKPAATPSIHFEVWLVAGKAASGAAGEENPALQEIEPALGGIRQSKGAVHFDLIEKLTLQTRAGDDDVEIQGARSSLRITATVRADAKGQPVVAAKINVRVGGRGGPDLGALKALAELRPGELLAIGQSSLSDKLWQFPSPTEKLSTDSSAGAQQLYYIVRASL